MPARQIEYTIKTRDLQPIPPNFTFRAGVRRDRKQKTAAASVEDTAAGIFHCALFSCIGSAFVRFAFTQNSARNAAANNIPMISAYRARNAILPKYSGL